MKEPERNLTLKRLNLDLENAQYYIENHAQELTTSQLIYCLKRIRLEIIRENILNYKAMLNAERKKLCEALRDYNQARENLEDEKKGEI